MSRIGLSQGCGRPGVFSFLGVPCLFVGLCVRHPAWKSMLGVFFFILVIVIFSLLQHTRLCVVFGVWNVKIICVLFAGKQKDYPNE